MTAPIEFTRLSVYQISLMILCVALCVIFEAVNLALKKRITPKRITGWVIILKTALLLSINLLGYDIHPKIKQILYTVLFFVSLFLLLSEIKLKAISLILGAVICVVFVFGVFLFDNAEINKTVDGTDYVAVYSKWTGIGPTLMYYHERHFLIFIETRAEFVADYGVVFSGFDKIPEQEPYGIYYLD